MLKFWQVLVTQCENLTAWPIYFWSRDESKIPTLKLLVFTLITQISVTYLTCRPSLVSNNQWIKPRKHIWLMWTNIRLRKTNSEALFFCLLYSPLHNSYKSGSNVVLLSLYQCCIVPKISKVGKCHCDNVVLSAATKTNKQKARTSHFKSTSGQQFCSRICGLHTFGRKQRLLRHAPQSVRLDLAKTKSESSQTGLWFAVILMYLFNFWGGLYWLIISILNTRLCLTFSTVLESG